MILGGMCKKHYDEVNGVKKGKGSRANVTVAKKKDTSGTDDGKKKKGGHQRGLSLFQDNDLMNAIVNNGPTLQDNVEDDGLRGLSIDT